MHIDVTSNGWMGVRVSATFVLLCVKALLDLSDSKAIECLTEGGNDLVGIVLRSHVDGEYLLTDLGIQFADLDHRNFGLARQRIEEVADEYFDRATYRRR